MRTLFSSKRNGLGDLMNVGKDMVNWQNGSKPGSGGIETRANRIWAFI